MHALQFVVAGDEALLLLLDIKQNANLAELLVELYHYLIYCTNPICCHTFSAAQLNVIMVYHIAPPLCHLQFFVRGYLNMGSFLAYFQTHISILEIVFHSNKININRIN